MSNKEIEITPINQDKNATPIEEEGQLALDIYQTPEEFVIIAPIAGLEHKDIDIIVNEEILVIKGERREKEHIAKQNYLVRECYFGPFSRSIILPLEADSKNIKATFNKCILEIRINKTKQIGPTKIEIDNLDD